MYFFLILLILTFNNDVNSASPEQIALNYFIDEVANENYKNALFVYKDEITKQNAVLYFSCYEEMYLSSELKRKFFISNELYTTDKLICPQKKFKKKINCFQRLLKKRKLKK